MAFGFLIIFISAMAGVFLVSDIELAFMKDKDLLLSWMHILQKTSHGHFNLFGMLHILFGLTLPYARHEKKLTLFLTACLVLGSLAMGPCLLIKSFLANESLMRTSLDYLVGGFLSLSLIAIGCHTYSLFKRFV